MEFKSATKDQVLELLYQSIDEVNQQLDPEESISKSADLVLLGNSSSMDSLSFVNFIALVEAGCEQRFGVALSLTGEEDSFITLGELADLIGRVLSERDRLTGG